MAEIYKSKKILFIEEDPVTLSLLRIRFESLKYNLFIASCVKKALELVRKDAPDLILLSDRISLKHCLAFCRVIKENPETSNIPIVVLLSNNESKQDFLTLGLNDIIQWPYDGDVILNCIRKIFICKILEKKVKTDDIHYDVNDPNFIAKIKRILIFERNSDVAKFMSSQLKQDDKYIDIINDENLIINKALEIEPNVILMNAETESISARKIIEELNNIPHLEIKIFLYMCFRKSANADKSDLHYFYQNCLKDISAKTRFQLYYWGVFEKESFKSAVESFLNN